VDSLIGHDLHHLLVDRAGALQEGWTGIKEGAGGAVSIDVIRSTLFQPTDLKPLNQAKPGLNNGLFDRMEDFRPSAIAESQVMACRGYRRSLVVPELMADVDAMERRWSVSALLGSPMPCFFGFNTKSGLAAASVSCPLWSLSSRRLSARSAWIGSTIGSPF
jgi:hypothetical protein